MAKAKPKATYEFEIVVSGVDHKADGFENAFYETGCSDATIAIQRGKVCILFAREDTTMANAVISAIQDIEKAGAVVETVKLCGNEIDGKRGNVDTNLGWIDFDGDIDEIIALLVSLKEKGANRIEDTGSGYDGYNYDAIGRRAETDTEYFARIKQDVDIVVKRAIDLSKVRDKEYETYKRLKKKFEKKK